MNDAFDVIEGDVLIDSGRIISVGATEAPALTPTIDAGGDYLLPGFVQTHIHLCQTLFRGYADDLALLDWLRTRIWPMEAAHTPRSLAAAASLAAAELLLGGTTSVLTMETVHDTDAVFEALEPTGLRAVVGKCMMDADPTVPRAVARAHAGVRGREPGAGVRAGTAGPTGGCERPSRRDSPCRARANCSRPSRTCRGSTRCSSTATHRRTATRSRWSASAPALATSTICHR